MVKAKYIYILVSATKITDVKFPEVKNALPSCILIHAGIHITEKNDGSAFESYYQFKVYVNLRGIIYLYWDMQ